MSNLGKCGKTVFCSVFLRLQVCRGAVSNPTVRDGVSLCRRTPFFSNRGSPILIGGNGPGKLLGSERAVARGFSPEAAARHSHILVASDVLRNRPVSNPKTSPKLPQNLNTA